MKFWLYTCTVLLCCCIQPVQAQSGATLGIYGKVVTCDGSLEGVEITWKATRNPVPISLNEKGDFFLDMDFNELYTITISKEGCRKLIIKLNTTISNMDWDEGVDDIHTTLYLPPAGEETAPLIANMNFDKTLDQYTYVETFMRTLKLQLAHYQPETTVVAKVDTIPPKDTSLAVVIEPVKDTVPVIVADTIPKDTLIIAQVDTAALAEARSQYNIVSFASEEERKKVMDTGERAALTGNIFVILKKYDAYEKLNSNHFGFINFGNGSGNIEVSLEEFERYKKVFNK